MNQYNSSCDPKTFLKRYKAATKGFAIHTQESDDEGASDDGHFSWSPCETCGCTLGGQRYDAVLTNPGVTKSGRRHRLVHVRSCGDCLMYAANGVLPGEG